MNSVTLALFAASVLFTAGVLCVLDDKVAIVTGAQRRIWAGIATGTWRRWATNGATPTLESKNTKAGQCDDRSALHEHRTPCMEAHNRAARPDVLVDER